MNITKTEKHLSGLKARDVQYIPPVWENGTIVFYGNRYSEDELYTMWEPELGAFMTREFIDLIKAGEVKKSPRRADTQKGAIR